MKGAFVAGHPGGKSACWKGKQGHQCNLSHAQVATDTKKLGHVGGLAGPKTEGGAD